MPTTPACDPSVSIAPLARLQHQRDLGVVRPGVEAEVSCSWMGLAIGRREPLFADVRVTLGRRNICMPKKLLNSSEVGTAIESPSFGTCGGIVAAAMPVSIDDEFAG